MNESVVPFDAAKPQPPGPSLETVDQALLDQYAQGPSSLIDQDVLAALGRLRDKQNPPAVWQLILNPVAGYQTLRAFWGETSAHANARRAIATAVLTQVEWGKEDMKRDAVLNYMTSLKTALGPMLPEFCRQHGVPVPPEKPLPKCSSC